MHSKRNDLILQNDNSYDSNNILLTERNIVPKNLEFFKPSHNINSPIHQKEHDIKRKPVKPNILGTQSKITDKIYYNPINSSPNIFDKDNLYNLFLLFQYYSSLNKDKNSKKISIPSLVKENMSNTKKFNNLKSNNITEKEIKNNIKEINIQKKTNNECFINYGIINTNSFSACKLENSNKEDKIKNKLLVKKKQ